MPFTIMVSEGTVTKEAGQILTKELSELVLELHGLSDNPFMRAMVVAEILTIPTDWSTKGAERAKIAVVEGKVPGFAFPTPEIKSEYVQRVSDLLATATAGTVDRSNIFTNTSFTADGLWGINGKAYTNEELGAEIAAAAHAPA